MNNVKISQNNKHLGIWRLVFEDYSQLYTKIWQNKMKNDLFLYVLFSDLLRMKH